MYASRYTRSAFFTTSSPFTVMSFSSAKPRPTRYSIVAFVNYVSVVGGEAAEIHIILAGRLVGLGQARRSRHRSELALVDRKPRASHGRSFTLIVGFNAFLHLL